MNHRSLLYIMLAASALLWFGCDVQTDSQPPLSYPPANHVVINEVYTLPTSNPNAHTWVEIYNPTSQKVNLRRWSLSYKTLRYKQLGFVFYNMTVDTTQHPPVTRITPAGFFSSSVRDSQAAVYDVPIVRPVDSISVKVLRLNNDTVGVMIADTSGDLFLYPGEFLTLVSDLNRLKVYNSIGPGGGPAPESTPQLPMRRTGDVGLYRIVTLERDSANPRLSSPDTLFGVKYDFFLGPTDQLVLKDSTGQAVDVVRYGNYTYSGGADPYPSYHSVGLVPEYESIARYAGAYDTRNTANDFYVTGVGLRPIPQWLSQMYKK